MGVIKHGFLGIFWGADNIFLLQQLNITTINNRFIIGSIGYSWLISSLSSILLAIQSLYQNIQEKEKINLILSKRNSETIKKKRRQRQIKKQKEKEGENH